LAACFFVTSRLVRPAPTILSGGHP
jgi:hypothetical protein